MILDGKFAVRYLLCNMPSLQIMITLGDGLVVIWHIHDLVIVRSCNYGCDDCWVTHVSRYLYSPNAEVFM